MIRVVGAAKSYRGPRLSIDDLIQEGGIGPVKAVDKFDPDKGDRLCIRATWWIGDRWVASPQARRKVDEET